MKAMERARDCVWNISLLIYENRCYRGSLKARGTNYSLLLWRYRDSISAIHSSLSKASSIRFSIHRGLALAVVKDKFDPSTILTITRKPSHAYYKYNCISKYIVLLFFSVYILFLMLIGLYIFSMLKGNFLIVFITFDKNYTTIFSRDFSKDFLLQIFPRMSN